MDGHRGMVIAKGLRFTETSRELAGARTRAVGSVDRGLITLYSAVSSSIDSVVLVLVSRIPVRVCPIYSAFTVDVRQSIKIGCVACE